MLFKITNGAVSFGSETVLENINFEINSREKIAVVGRNGAGKSTLLKCITGRQEMEEGTGDEPFSVSHAGNPRIGYLEQISFTDDSKSLLDEILTVFSGLISAEKKMQELLSEIEKNPDEKKISEYSALSDRFEFEGGYTYKKEYSVMLKNFGFSQSDLSKPLSDFSGGQRTKIAFMKLLLSHPDILLLDEPTNHLDINSVKWLEGYIRSYRSAAVIVSHDRMFIEKTADRICEIEYGETRMYRGNYSDYERQKREEYLKQVKDYDYIQKEIRRLSAVVERFRYKATKAAMAQSKLKQIERLRTVEKPERYDLSSFHANFQPDTETVMNVLEVKNLKIGYTEPLAEINLNMERGRKLGVIGDNGTGKSTFLKTLTGDIPALSGSFSFGLRTKTGYFSQQMAQYSSPLSVYDDFHDKFPSLTETEVRTCLGSFLFTGDDVFKKVSDLSGGERVRLALCKLFKRRPNFLILDEPTNHMDIVGKETLEDMLREYTGTVILVSHDRYLINKVTDSVLLFENGSARLFPYGYTQYEEYAETEQEKAVPESGIKTGGKKNYSSPLKDKAKKEKQLKKLEARIDESENKIARLTQALQDPSVYSDYVKLSEIQTVLEAEKKQRDEMSEQWLEVSEELENS